MDLQDVGQAVQMAGIVAFAVTAVLAVAPQNVSLFTACVMGIITAVGGGTMRDVIVGVPVFWAADQAYIWVATGASFIAFWTHKLLTSRAIFRLMLYLDGFGAALFTVQATAKVWNLGFGVPVAPVILGIVTAIGGGLVRDVLAGRPTLLMNQEFYAVPVLIGSTLFVVLMTLFPGAETLCAMVCISVTFALRAAAIHWGLGFPDWLTTRTPPKGRA